MTYSSRPPGAEPPPAHEPPPTGAAVPPAPRAPGTAAMAPPAPGTAPPAPGTAAGPGAGTAAPGQGERPRKPRDPFFDNAKYFAILLVVAGHVIANVRSDVPIAKALYLFIYMFHMPLFIVITGYLSRNWTFSTGKARKLITHVGVPYVVFEVAYEIYAWLGEGGELTISLLKPYWLMWFMCALFLWRLSTPVWQQIRWPLGIALLFALLSYMSDLGGTFNIHRVLGLLPLYVLGLTLKPEHFELLKKPIARPIGAAVLAGGLAMAYFAKDRMTESWVFWKTPYEDLGVSNVTGTVMTLAMFSCATVLVAAFLAVVPRGRHWFSALGATTLYTYLLHGFIIRLLDYLDWWDSAWMHTVPGTIILLGASAVLGTVLCSPLVVRCMSWALEPKMTWAFTSLRRPAGRGAAGKGGRRTAGRPAR
ncbi:acyltransferase family protein [Actinomadura sp. NAK00032]|uniref:acyltransferase family protein n=1 Tax=Actinomadura sp. NAK00032 TaxID=2742128 RepID=UPI0020C7FCE5|nr:acyltransferase family protein [Actinomadura sp. NAK00032]